MASSFSAALAAARPSTRPSATTKGVKAISVLTQTFKGEETAPASWTARKWAVQTASPEVALDFSALASMEAALEALDTEASKQAARNRAAKAARLKAAKATVLARIAAFRAIAARVGSNVAQKTMQAFEDLKKALTNRRTAAMARQEARSAAPYWAEVTALRARMADLVSQFPALAAL